MRHGQELNKSFLMYCVSSNQTESKCQDYLLMSNIGERQVIEKVMLHVLGAVNLTTKAFVGFHNPLMPMTVHRYGVLVQSVA